MNKMVKTVIEILKQDCDQLKKLFEELISKYSEIYRWNEPDSFIISTHLYSWKDLPIEGKQLQSRIFKEYLHFAERSRLLLLNQPPDSIASFDESKNEVIAIINQENTYLSSQEEALNEVYKNLDNQIKLLDNIYDQSSGKILYVPDTNALLANPRIEQWRFADVSEFEIILTPTVLSELDKLKIAHRMESVRKKTEGLIRQIKGYRGRGKLNDGIPLVNRISTLKSIAVEPNFNKTLSWLDPSNDDDRILASFIEVMKIYPNSPVIIVTNDINMQNKAEFAGIPFVEPPGLIIE